MWPSYEQILKKAKLLKDISFIDAGTLPTFEHIIENVSNDDKMLKLKQKL